MSHEQEAYEIEGLWDDKWFGPHEHEKVARLAETIPADANSLLDVGCGNGLFLRSVAEKRSWARLCGVDRSGAALAHVATEKVAASADALPFRDREFDIVTSFDVIEHLPLAVFERALREIVRVSSKYVLIAVPFDEDIRSSVLECPSCACLFNVNYHMRSFDDARVRALFERLDVRCTKVMRLGPFTTYPRALTRAVFRAKIALGRTNDELPDYAICPVCGYRGRAVTTPGGTGLPRYSVAKDVLKRLVPKRETHRWIAGLYERT